MSAISVNSLEADGVGSHDRVLAKFTIVFDGIVKPVVGAPALLARQS